MKRIIVDIDGVLASFNGAFTQRLTTLGVVTRPWEDGKNPAMWDWFHEYGATPEQGKAAWKAAWNDPQWWGTFDPHPEFTVVAYHTLGALIRHHEVTFVSSRPPSTRDVTARWLRNHIVNDTPHVVITPKDKLPVLIGMDPDIIIEDRLSTLEAYAKHDSTKTLLLVDRAYNRGAHATIIREPSTQDALKTALNIASGMLV